MAIVAAIKARADAAIRLPGLGGLLRGRVRRDPAPGYDPTGMAAMPGTWRVISRGASTRPPRARYAAELPA